MDENKKNIFVSSAPHIRTGESVRTMMWTVVLALVPSTGYSIYLFGINPVIIIASSIAAAAAAEAVYQLIMKKPVSITDGSAVLAGFLVALNVPPESPVWMPVIGSFFAIIIVKQLFGGLGFNIFNPALSARAFLMASWPMHMTTKWHKFMGLNVISPELENRFDLPPAVFDAITQATPLTVLKEAPKILQEYNIDLNRIYDVVFSGDMLKALFIGNRGGCIGEISAMLLLLGGVFLLARKVITWHIPVSCIFTVGIFAYIYYSILGYPDPAMGSIFHVLTGGLILGAFFMATDPVTSPVSGKGMIIFGAGCGALIFIIRVWGGFPEGVCYGILLMNAVTPLIDRYTKPKVFGKKSSTKEKKG
ncbi:MAG: RnfABCDGE type electron transport complex subunit D [Spirochaetes bacterium]|jgi:electron transport complex protein RnfD|nr:RnfABCDGE type electron transport complex subunit D [Spirochaetota bacterium]